MRIASRVAALIEFLRGYPNPPPSSTLPNFTTGNVTTPLIDGNEILAATVEQIQLAKHSIRMQVMVFHPDVIGQALIAEIIQACQRGVKVQLSFDLYRSVYGSRAVIVTPQESQAYAKAMEDLLQQLKSAGGQYCDNPPGTRFSLNGVDLTSASIQYQIQHLAFIEENHVDHRKFLVVDDHTAIIMGANVGKHYLYRLPHDKASDMKVEAEQRLQAGLAEAWEKWSDIGTLITGEAVEAFIAEFNWRWAVLGGKVIEDQRPDRVKAESKSAVRVLRQSNAHRDLATTMFELVSQATQSIFLVSPYISYDPFLKTLINASQRGVQVTMIIVGDHNDISLSMRLIRSRTKWLVGGGINVFECNQRMIHAKILLVDDSICSIGSFNFNFRSFIHDLEQNIVVKDSDFATQVMNRFFSPTLQMSNKIDKGYVTRFNPLEKLITPLT